MTTDEQRPAPLRESSRALLRAYREAHAMPPLAKTRVLTHFANPAVPAAAPAVVRRMSPWAMAGVAVATAAAAAALLTAISGPSHMRTTSDDRPAEQAPATVEGSDARSIVSPAVPEEPVRPTTDTAEVSDSVGDGAPLQPSHLASPAPTAPSVDTSDARRRTPRSTSTRPESPVSTLSEENRLIRAAWSHLDDDRNAARAAIDEHARRFPKGILAPERRALAVIVDCVASAPGAAARAEAFLVKHPEGVLTRKVRDACKKLSAP